jgi:urease accessory protein
MAATSSSSPETAVTGPPCLIVTRMVAEESPRPEGEQIVLRAERRLFLKRRWRGAAADGTEFGFDLESRLHDGCVIHRTAAADYIVRQEHEPVYVLRPRSVEEAALQGWMIGNLHMGVEITGGEIRALHDPAVRQLLERQGWPFEERTLLFNPLRVTAHAS